MVKVIIAFCVVGVFYASAKSFSSPEVLSSFLGFIGTAYEVWKASQKRKRKQRQ